MGTEASPKPTNVSVVHRVAVGFFPTVLEMMAIPKKKTAPTTPITRVLTGCASVQRAESGRLRRRDLATQPMTTAIASPHSVHCTIGTHHSRLIGGLSGLTFAMTCAGQRAAQARWQSVTVHRTVRAHAWGAAPLRMSSRYVVASRKISSGSSHVSMPGNEGGSWPEPK